MAVVEEGEKEEVLANSNHLGERETKVCGMAICKDNFILGSRRHRCSFWAAKEMRYLSS